PSGVEAAKAGKPSARTRAIAVVSLLIAGPFLVVRLLRLFEFGDEGLHQLAELALLVREPLELRLLAGREVLAVGLVCARDPLGLPEQGLLDLLHRVELDQVGHERGLAASAAPTASAALLAVLLALEVEGLDQLLHL